MIFISLNREENIKKKKKFLGIALPITLFVIVKASSLCLIQEIEKNTSLKDKFSKYLVIDQMLFISFRKFSSVVFFTFSDF